MFSLIDQAIAFAAKAHEGQHRKTGNVPYIAHPVAVAMMLQAMGCGEAIIAAALLHDTVEDSNVDPAEIRSKFGDEVADIVAGCTELPKSSYRWEVRKNHHIESLRQASLAVKLVTAADKYHNLNHLLSGRPVSDPAVWHHFSRGVEQQAWYYRSIVESILTGVGQSEQYPIFDTLAQFVNEVFAGIPPLAPADLPPPL